MVEVKNLSKSFGSNVVLDGVSFEVDAGESIAVIGRSGTGKSVLIKHLIGLIAPDSGRVKVDGQDLVGMSERELLSVRQKFGMLFQGAALFDSLTVAENIAFPLRRTGCSDESEIAHRVDEVLNFSFVVGSAVVVLLLVLVLVEEGFIDVEVGLATQPSTV